MGWKEIGAGKGGVNDHGSDFQKWVAEGQVEGIWHGTVEGEYGNLGQIETAEGRWISFPMHTVLINKLEEIEEGQTQSRQDAL